MDETTAWSWAQAEFGHAQLGDERRTRRLVKIARDAVRRPRGTVTGVVDGSAEREGAFRLLENDAVEAAQIGRASHRATLERASGQQWVWVAVDQSTISVVDREGRKGLGKIGAKRRRGLEVMSALAIEARGVPLGLVGQQWWRRDDAKAPDYYRDRRPAEQRESDLWCRTMAECCALLAEAERPVRPWFQLDRGGDYWRVFEFAARCCGWLTVRSAYDRRVVGSDRKLRQTVRSSKVVARYSLPVVARRDGRGKMRRARQAQLSVRYAPVRLRLAARTANERTVEVTAVHVRERRAPKGEAIEWVLLSTWPVHNAHDALQVVHGYSQRWKVEEFHRSWKAGGCQLQRSQLRTMAALQRWATLLAAVAARAERLKNLSRQQPNAPASDELSRAEIDAAIVLSRNRKFKPGQQLTLGQAVTLVAEVGGYTGRSSGGPPGATTIRRGLDLVTASAAVVEGLKKM